jgi:hypothetical protein
MKDMNFARFKHFLEFSEKEKSQGDVLGRTCTVLGRIRSAALGRDRAGAWPVTLERSGLKPICR